jgi:hypothetical protein
MTAIRPQVGQFFIGFNNREQTSYAVIDGKREGESNCSELNELDLRRGNKKGRFSFREPPP